MTERDFDAQAFAKDIHELLVLATLRADAKHGYQIALDVEADSNGLFRFRHGTLYPILHRLEAEGLIRGTWAKGAGRRRKVYAITPAGRTRLAGGASRIEQVLSGLMALLGSPGRARA